MNLPDTLKEKMTMALGSLAILSQTACAQDADAAPKSPARSKAVISKAQVSRKIEQLKAKGTVVIQAKSPSTKANKPNSVGPEVSDPKRSSPSVPRISARGTGSPAKRVIMPADDCTDSTSQGTQESMDHPWPDGPWLPGCRFSNIKLNGSLGTEPATPVNELPHECFNCGMG